MANLGLIADYIVCTVQGESIMSGFQYQVGFDDIEDKFHITLNENLIMEINEVLEHREEVADVALIDNTFDVVIYTDYAPNYDPSDYEDFEN